MKQFKKLTAAILMAAAVLSGCSDKQQKKGEAVKSDTSEARKEMVRIMELQMQTVARSVEYPATLDPFEEVHLVPAQPGRIDAIYADVGDRITKGKLLVQMDRTQLHQAEIQLKNLEADFSRLDTLSKYGSVAQQQFDQLKTQYEIASSNVKFLKENTQLVSPFNGVISGRYYEPGEMFSGTPNTQAGKAAVLSLVQISQLKVRVPLSEKYFPMVKAGMEADIKVDIYPDNDFKGRIHRIHPTIDPMNRTFNAELIVNNNSGLLRPGMFVRITLDLDKEEAIILPSNAVLKLQGSNERYLFVEENGIAKRVSVTIGKRYDDNIEVFSEILSPGDKIIISGQSRLLDGVAVQVVN